MKTVGILLKEARMNRGYTLEEVESATKIRIKFLAALESDDFHLLPTPAIVRGFVNNYAEFLGLNSQTMLAFLRRQMNDASKTSLLPKHSYVSLERRFFQLTPSRFLAILLCILIGIFFIYLGVQYRQIKEPPHLSVESPRDQLVTNEKRIEIIGKTDPDATVMVNNSSLIVRSDGRFYDTLALEPGINRITIIATSRFGKTSQITRGVDLKQE